MEDELRQLLDKNAVENGSHRKFAWRCASESKLAALVDGKLESTAKRLLLAHLADCKSCLDQVAFLVESQNWVASDEIPVALKVKAKSLVSSKPGSSVKFAWGWATAALATCLVIGFIVTLTIRLRSSVSSPPAPDQTVAQQSQNPTGAAPTNPPRNPDAVAIASPPAKVKPSQPKADASVPVIRNARRENHLPKLLLPRDGAIVNAPLQLRWETVSDAVFYEVSIMTTTGETVLSQRTDATLLSVAADTLTPGTKYFISVRAHLRDGQTTRSSPVSFRVSQ